jgi:hypothetical protein
MPGLRLNPVFPTIPLGTLAANLIGGYVIGLAVAFFAVKTELPPLQPGSEYLPCALRCEKSDRGWVRPNATERGESK